MPIKKIQKKLRHLFLSLSLHFSDFQVLFLRCLRFRALKAWEHQQLEEEAEPYISLIH